MLRLLSEDSYLLEELRSADETKTHPKAKLQNVPTFIGNGSHCHVCLLLVVKIKKFTYKLCKRQSADTNTLIGWYLLSAKRPIIGRYRLSADYQCISSWHTDLSISLLWWFINNACCECCAFMVNGVCLASSFWYGQTRYKSGLFVCALSGYVL